MEVEPGRPRIESFLAPLFAFVVASGAAAQVGSVRAWQEIGHDQGGFQGDMNILDMFGRAVCSPGDVDGDGIPDLAVGSPGNAGGGLRSGAVWILFMNEDGTVRAHHKINGSLLGTAYTFFGSSICSLGDLDANGTPDIAVGATGFNGSGAVALLFLNPDGSPSSHPHFSPPLMSTDFGCAVTQIHDVDGNGVRDLAAGARWASDGGSHQGSVWILLLAADGTVVGTQTINATSGGFGGDLDPSDQFGYSLTGLEDLDGNGVRDLAVGAFGDDDGGNGRGAVWILFLNADATVASEQKISSTEGGFQAGSASSFGCSVALVGDVDRDGTVDLAVGDLGDDPSGALWLLGLTSDGTVHNERKINATSGGFGGSLQSGDLFGWSVCPLGDLDGDGATELAVGAPGDDGGIISVGAAWVLFLEPHVKLTFETEDDFTTPLVNGQDLSSPPELGTLVSLSAAGPNAGAAIFDSTPGGPNDPSQDRDLLVGRGNVLILQTDANPSQTVPGFFNRPNDDEDGGTLAFEFVSAIRPAGVDLIDIDFGAVEASRVVLIDRHGRTRVYVVPPGWTGDLLTDGVARRTLDLTTLDLQPGFASSATAAQEPGFEAAHVLTIEIELGGSGAVDDLSWFPPAIKPRRPAPRPLGRSIVPGPAARPY